MLEINKNFTKIEKKTKYFCFYENFSFKIKRKQKLKKIILFQIQLMDFPIDKYFSGSKI